MYDIKISLILIIFMLFFLSFASGFSVGTLVHLNGPDNAIVLRKKYYIFYSELFFLEYWEIKVFN